MADYLTDAFIRLRQRLKRVSCRILPDADGAEDILQDSFVRLWRRQYPLQSEKEAEALLTRTVRNASLNERRRARSVPLERDYADDSPDTQEKERAFAQMKEKIQAELTDTQRYILEEKEYGGRTLEEIAAELIQADAAEAQSAETEMTGELLTYALIQPAPFARVRRYLCYQARPVGAAWIITILYLEGSATLDDLRSMFEKQ